MNVRDCWLRSLILSTDMLNYFVIINFTSISAAVDEGETTKSGRTFLEKWQKENGNVDQQRWSNMTK